MRYDTAIQVEQVSFASTHYEFQCPNTFTFLIGGFEGVFEDDCKPKKVHHDAASYIQHVRAAAAKDSL